MLFTFISHILYKFIKSIYTTIYFLFFFVSLLFTLYYILYIYRTFPESTFLEVGEGFTRILGINNSDTEGCIVCLCVARVSPCLRARMTTVDVG